MSPKLTIFVFAALLLVARAVPVSEDIQSSDNVDDVIEEAERSDDKVDLTELKDEDFREIVKYVQENLKRAVGKLYYVLANGLVDTGFASRCRLPPRAGF